MKNFTKLMIGLFLVLALSSNTVLADEGSACSPPYKPSNIFKVTFNYSKGMEYISSAEKTCSDKFADELVETFRDSMFISQGCLDVTIEDVEEAKANRAVPTAGAVLSLPPFILDLKV